MDYYKGRSGMQVFDFIDEFDLNFNLGNVAKYICRAGKKGSYRDGINDLEKAKHYIEREIDERKRRESHISSHITSDLLGLARYENSK